VPAENYREIVRTHPRFDRLEIGELLFARYTCPVNERFFPSWSEVDAVIYTISGRKIWHTPGGSIALEGGQALLQKKGSVLNEQFFDEDFCMIVSFLPDDFVAGIVRDLSSELPAMLEAPDLNSTVMPFREDPAIRGYFQSIETYFSGEKQPSEQLLRVKLRELVTSILFSGVNPQIASYLRYVGAGGPPPLAQIMENNFACNLSMEAFARMCHRSLSSFKRDFRKHFGETPGRWLLNRRLEYATELLRSAGKSVTQIAFESGFEDVSHFSRAFKGRYGQSPSQFRNETIPTA
jgi:AraC-like DNA-binding protein